MGMLSILIFIRMFSSQIEKIPTDSAKFLALVAEKISNIVKNQESERKDQYDYKSYTKPE